MSLARSAQIETSANLEAALEQWSALLGQENVILDPADLRAAETATYGTNVAVPAIIRPATCEEVQEVLRIANRFTVAVYPVSGGCNWGYG